MLIFPFQNPISHLAILNTKKHRILFDELHVNLRPRLRRKPDTVDYFVNRPYVRSISIEATHNEAFPKKL